MKRFFLFATLIAWLSTALSAQSLDALTRAIVEPLDKTSLSSGILLQQAPIFVQPTFFRLSRCSRSTPTDTPAQRLVFFSTPRANVQQHAAFF